MTAIAFALNCLLAMLLLAAMMVGLRLEKRLKGLRDSHSGFAKAAAELNAAIARAEGGLGEMRAALKEAEETLTERVDEARVAARKLEAAMQRVPSLPQAVAAPEPIAARPVPAAGQAPVSDEDEVMEDLPIRELLAKLRGAISAEDRGEAQVLSLHDRVDPGPAVRSRARIDDDLFEADERAFRRAGLGR
jgi:hypothetical protein